MTAKGEKSPQRPALKSWPLSLPLLPYPGFHVLHGRNEGLGDLLAQGLVVQVRSRSGAFPGRLPVCRIH